LKKNNFVHRKGRVLGYGSDLWDGRGVNRSVVRRM
jgi:hypothetical protein